MTAPSFLREAFFLPSGSSDNPTRTAPKARVSISLSPRRLLFYFGVDVDVGAEFFLSLNLLEIIRYLVQTPEYKYIYKIYQCRTFFLWV